MKMFLISDNLDTKIGLRLAGVDGVVVHDEKSADRALCDAIEKKDCAVILITDKLSSMLSDKIREIKLQIAEPLIVTIPDRHGKSDNTAIEKYVREAIGLNI